MPADPSMSPAAVRIAMWSGPRNISTAMMRAFDARGDCAVCDEPLYAHYLHETRLAHPAAQEVIASQSTNWREVVAELLGPVPGAKALWYQKHMSHHLLEVIDRQWILPLRNAFLIRSPRAMLASLARVLDQPRIEDTGLPQQVALFEWLTERTGLIPPVVDSEDVLRDPPALLSALCAHLRVPFTEAMLTWAPGPRASDGVWAEHWYGSVTNSAGFSPWQAREVEVPEVVAPLVAPCEALYAKLYRHRLR
ncbi:MAG: HAD family hydrolase [Pseudomonadota bacterium]